MLVFAACPSFHGDALACSSSPPSGNQVDGLPLVANLMKLGFLDWNLLANMLIPSFTPIHTLDAEHVAVDLRNGRAHDTSIFEKYHLEAVRDAQTDLSEAKSLC